MSGHQGDPNAGINATRKQVDEVVDVMRTNVELVMERDANLQKLEQTAANLEEGSHQFQRTSVKLKKKMWWENQKMKLVFAGIAAVVVLLVIILIASSGSSDDSDSDTDGDEKDDDKKQDDDDKEDDEKNGSSHLGPALSAFSTISALLGLLYFNVFFRI